MKLTKNKNFLTLVSLLSVLLAFVLTVALCLFACDRLGIVRLSSFDGRKREESGETGGRISLPTHTELSLAAKDIPSGASYYEKILRNAPFVDNYYLKLRVSSVPLEDSDAPPSGEYEIWHFGSRYRIHWYDESRVKKVTICDGTRVQVIDYQNASTDYFLVSDGYAYEDMTPIPRFVRTTPLVREVFEYSEKDGLCMAACEYPTLSMLDTVRFSMSTGVLRSFARFRNGQMVMTMDVVSTDLDFKFSNYMFEIK